MKYVPGLVSVTFRNLSVERVVQLVHEAKLVGIEWGGDVHVPHGDRNAAAHARKVTRDAGLEIAAYGSYYRAGRQLSGSVPFDAVLESAITLDAPLIRVWAGNQGSADADASDWSAVTDDLHRIAALASDQNIVLGLEFHGGTLTDTNETTLRLLEAVDLPNVKTLWQPSTTYDEIHRIEGLRNLIPRLANIHVFRWVGTDRVPLELGADEWARYFAEAANSTQAQTYALLEFVKDDSEEQFKADAEQLLDLINPYT